VVAHFIEVAFGVGDLVVLLVLAEVTSRDVAGHEWGHGRALV
jgi:hypothetical protein